MRITTENERQSFLRTESELEKFEASRTKFGQLRAVPTLLSHIVVRQGSSHIIEKDIVTKWGCGGISNNLTPSVFQVHVCVLR